MHLLAKHKLPQTLIEEICFYNLYEIAIKGKDDLNGHLMTHTHTKKNQLYECSVEAQRNQIKILVSDFFIQNMSITKSKINILLDCAQKIFWCKATKISPRKSPQTNARKHAQCH